MGFIVRYRLLSFGEKFVLVNYRGNRHFVVRVAVIHANHFSFAAHPNALGQSDLRRKGKCEFDSCPDLHVRIKEEANTSGANVPSLGGFQLGVILGIGYGYRESQRETASRPLLRSAADGSVIRQVTVSMASWRHGVKAVVPNLRAGNQAEVTRRKRQGKGTNAPNQSDGSEL